MVRAARVQEPKDLVSRLNEGRCNHRHRKVRSLKERSDALLCTLPNSPFVVGWLPGGFGAALVAAGIPRSGASRASGSARGYCGVGFVRRHRGCLSQPAVAGPMPFLATVVAHVSLLGLALGTCRGTLSRLVLLVPLVGFVSSFTLAVGWSVSRSCRRTVAVAGRSCRRTVAVAGRSCRRAVAVSGRLCRRELAAECRGTVAVEGPSWEIWERSSE